MLPLIPHEDETEDADEAIEFPMESVSDSMSLTMLLLLLSVPSNPAADVPTPPPPPGWFSMDCKVSM